MNEQEEYENAVNRFTCGGCATLLAHLLKKLPEGWTAVWLNYGTTDSPLSHVVAESPCRKFWLDITGLHKAVAYTFLSPSSERLRKAQRLSSSEDLIALSTTFVEKIDQEDPDPEHTETWANFLLDGAGLQ